jgi:glycosyltransferase involved in cell wall biosynthesis
VPDQVRVLQITGRYLPDLGGIETHVHEISTRLSELPGFTVTVGATDRRGEYPARDLSGQVPVVRARAWPARRDWYFAPGLARLIRTGGWDVVHIQGIHTLVPVIGMLAARRAGIPYMVTFHTGGSSSGLRRHLRSLQWRLLAPLLRDAAQLVGVSRYERRLFAEAIGVPVDEIAVIANGGGLPLPDRAITAVPGRVVSCGRLERYKGHHRVIKALPALRKILPEAHLHILGSGPYEGALRELAARLGVEDAVTIRLVPPGDRTAMAVSLMEASAFAALSDYEAHPVSVMEAVALGIPVVGRNIAGMTDLIDDGLVTGIGTGATPVETAAAIYQAIMAAPGARPSLPTWDQAVQELGEHYRQVARRGGEPVAVGPRS